METTLSKYDAQAAAFLARFGFKLTVEPRTPENCPDWGGSARQTKTRFDCPRCGQVHGREYLVTLRREAGNTRPLTFSFWGAHADRPSQIPFGKRPTLWEEELAKWTNKGKDPSAYAVLSCLSSDASMPDTADEVAAEFGPMPPSRAESVAAHARRVRAYFTEAERDALAEIQ